MTFAEHWWLFKHFGPRALWSLFMMLALGWVAIFSGWYWLIRLVAAVPFTFGMLHLIWFFGWRAVYKARGI